MMFTIYCLQDAPTVSRRALRKGVLMAIRKKMVDFVDDAYMLIEWGVAGFLDPRARDLLVSLQSNKYM